MAKSETRYIRCINIDWLEIYCNEGGIRKDAAYFRAFGFEVKERLYGTPQYAQMFTIFQDHFPILEVRRAPYSLKTHGGIFFPGDCHLRLSNRQCYAPDPIGALREFIIMHRYNYKSISRIDLCLDFNQFDNHENPVNFIRSFMCGEISKLNQCKVAAHGTDNWEGRVWNSIKWGSPTSPINTKLYNKSLELKEQKPKFYIEDSWKAAQLDTTQDVWRVEFSIKSHIHGYVRLETGEFIESRLTNYDTRNKCLYMFHMLQSHYFDFRKVERTRNGLLLRKNRCTPLNLFTIAKTEPFKPIHLTKQHEPTRTDKMLIKRLHQIIEDPTYTDKDRLTAQSMLNILVDKMRAKTNDRLIMIREVIKPALNQLTNAVQ